MLSDGTQLAVGDWISTPVKALAQSPEFYPSPLEFHGFRFAAEDALAALVANEKEVLVTTCRQPESSKLVDIEQSWQVWGFGRMAWYVPFASFPTILPFEVVETLTL